ncbi:16S rRNA (uracil(1498)-N(3))-methyltransferase [bacterium]|nr:16S rRNA (uracil(1498)-N(3))-methyltransferase [bacterium]
MLLHHESYYVDPGNIKDDLIVLTEQEVHHLSRVKRHKMGDVILAVDGCGVAYEVELIRISKLYAEGRILQIKRRMGEPTAEITLVQAIIKGDRFDWIIEKCVEIGVRRIIPLISEKTIVKAGSGKINRWKRIALGAMKQCGRSFLPEISQPRTLEQGCALGANCQYRLIAHPGPDSQPVQLTKPATHQTPRAICMVGPEGGFTAAEVDQALENGYTPVSLGSRRLRAETAGIVLTSIMLSQWDELC